MALSPQRMMCGEGKPWSRELVSQTALERKITDLTKYSSHNTESAQP